MTATPARRSRSRPLSAATRLGVTALILLALVAAALAGHTYEQLRGMRHESERVRAQLMAQSVSQRIAHAIDIGIPLDRLIGVEALFNQRLAAHSEIQSIALMQGPDKVLWFVERESQAGQATGTVADAPVVVRSDTVGLVRLTLQETGAGPFARTAAALLLPTVLLLAALAFLAARFCEAHGLQLRNHAVRLATRAITSGAYDRSVVLPNRRGFDLRAQQLSHAVRGVHETLVRVRRLIASLRQTEPQALRREYLDRLLAEAEGNDRFAEHGLSQLKVVAAESQAFWTSLLISLTAAGLLGLTLAADAPSAAHGGWMVALFFAVAGAAGRITSRRQWAALSVLFGACGALVVVALALLVGALDTFTDLQQLALLAAGSGMLAGAALAACMTVEQLPERSTLAHAMPRWHGATWGAWLSATLWLGPALGTVAYTALGEMYGTVALLLPIVCAGFLLLRWNEPRSPWRTRLGQLRPHPSSAASHPRPAMAPRLALGVTAGLLAVQCMVANASVAAQPLNAALASALGVGLLAGLLGRTRARPSRWQGPMLVAALVCGLLALAVPATHGARSLGLAAAALFTGWVLGQVFTHTQRTARIPLGAMLLACSVGAALAAGMHSADWPLASLGLAAWLALAWATWMEGRRAVRTAPADGGHDAA